jgi:hypothetical protein
MSPGSRPPIQALGITQEWAGTSWKATGYVEGVGWLAAWGPSLITAMETRQALAGGRVAEVDGVDGTRAYKSTIPEAREGDRR